MILYPLFNREVKLRLNMFLIFQVCSIQRTLHCEKVEISFEENITAGCICLIENKFRWTCHGI